MEEKETKIIYYVNDEKTPYLVELAISPDKVTLGDFKNVFNRPNYKFFFKSMFDGFGEVKKEIIKDDAHLPCVNGLVVSWLVSAEGSNVSDGGASQCTDNVVPKMNEHGKKYDKDEGDSTNNPMNQLDFTRLFSKQSHLLTSQNENLRKDFYLVWTNSENLRELFRSVLLQIDFFFRTYLLEITGSYVPEKDILYVLTSMPKEKLRISEHVSNQPQTIQVNLDVSDHPVSIPVYIANTILSAHDRTFASTKLNKIGCQYLYIHKHMLDSSTPTSSASEDLDQEGQPLLKKMKTCQKAKYVKCDGDLKRHRENSCTLTENKLCVDVLIYCSSEKVNLNLAKYLGLISLEACIREADVNANYDEVFEIRMDNKNAKIYRLAQAYVNRKLMMGYSNICLTCTYALFKYAQANVKACIFTKSDSISDIVDFSDRACFCVKIENEQNIVEFIAAVTNIINQVLKVKSSIKAVFFRSDDQLCKSFETTEIPLTCVVPLYILRYFSQVLICQSGLEELSYSSI